MHSAGITFESLTESCRNGLHRVSAAVVHTAIVVSAKAAANLEIRVAREKCLLVITSGESINWSHILSVGPIWLSPNLGLFPRVLPTVSLGIAGCGRPADGASGETVLDTTLMGKGQLQSGSLAVAPNIR